jgi:hypothetical protein
MRRMTRSFILGLGRGRRGKMWVEVRRGIRGRGRGRRGVEAYD